MSLFEGGIPKGLIWGAISLYPLDLNFLLVFSLLLFSHLHGSIRVLIAEDHCHYSNIHMGFADEYVLNSGTLDRWSRLFQLSRS